MRWLRATRRWWLDSPRPWITSHQRAVLAAGPIVGALLSLVTNVLTEQWTWQLCAAFIALTSVSAAAVVLIDPSSPVKILRPGLLSIEPPRHSPTLFGRKRTVAKLAEAVHGDGPRIHVLHGLDGVGTSALAARIAIRMEKAGWAVWWVTATQPEIFQGGMRELAAELEADCPRPVDPERDVTNRLWSSLRSRDQPWLLVIDGADDLTVLGTHAQRRDLTGWLRAPRGQGAVILTTIDGHRGQFPHSYVRYHAITGVTPAAGADFLLALAPYAGEDDAAAELSHRLGGHSLAILLAGCYLAEAADSDATPATFREYSSVVARSGSAWWERLRPRRSGETRTLTAVWKRSLDLIENDHPGSRLLLGVLACMTTVAVPTLLLEAQKLHGSGLFGKDFAVQPVLERLSDLGLVTLTDSETAQIVTVHPLIQSLSRGQPEIQRQARAVDKLVHHLKDFPVRKAPARMRAAVSLAIEVDVPPTWKPTETVLTRLRTSLQEAVQNRADRAGREADRARREDDDRAAREVDRARREDDDRAARATDRARRDEYDRAARETDRAQRIDDDRAARATDRTRREHDDRAARATDRTRREHDDRVARAADRAQRESDRTSRAGRDDDPSALDGRTESNARSRRDTDERGRPETRHGRRDTFDRGDWDG